MALKPVKKDSSLADKAYDTIRDAIISNELPPGEVLTEERLSEQLSISRTPIRAALQRLIVEGLVEVRGKSMTVTSLSAEDIASISSVRLPLELLVIEHLQNKVTPHLIRLLRETISRQQQDLGMDGAAYFKEYIHQDHLFHTTLAQATGNRFLVDLIERINTHSNRCLMLYSTLSPDRNPAIQEHIRLVDCLETGDFEQARRAMCDHLLHVSDRHLQTPHP